MKDDYLNYENVLKEKKELIDIEIEDILKLYETFLVFYESLDNINKFIISKTRHEESPTYFVYQNFQYFSNSLIQELKNLKENVLIPFNMLNKDFVSRLSNQSKKVTNLLKELEQKKKNVEKDIKSYNDKIKKTKKKNDIEFNDFNERLSGEYEKEELNEFVLKNNEKLKEINNDFKIWNQTIIKNNKDYLRKFAFSICKLSEVFQNLSKTIFETLNNVINIISIKSNNEDNYQIIEYDDKNLNVNSSFMISNDKGTNIQNFVNQLKIDKRNIKIKEIIKIYNYVNLKNNLEIFFEEFSNVTDQEILLVKNKDNLVHLADIFNDLLLNNFSNFDIINKILEFSRMIKFKDRYISDILAMKNPNFQNLKFWNDLFNYNLIKGLNKSINKKIKKNQKIKTKEETEKEQLKLEEKIILSEEIKKKLIDYKKLKENEKLKLNIEFKEIILKELKKITEYLCVYSPKLMNEFLDKNCLNFSNDLNKMLYFNQIEEIYFLRKRNGIKLYSEEKNGDLTKKFIYFESISQFLPINDKVLFLGLSKRINKYLYNKIIIQVIMESDLSLSKRIKMWEFCLKINKLKTDYKFDLIKEEVTNDLKDENSGKNEYILKNKTIIKNDLERTIFVENDLNKFNSLNICLLSFFCSNKKLDYFQGMNYLISFIYQLVSQEERETFYFFYGLVMNTKLHEIFEDKFEKLNIFFLVFDKLLKINNPEIYYKLKKASLISSFYSSSWFITLFTDKIGKICINNPPLFFLFFIEKFISTNWTSIFIFGFTILEYNYNKIIEAEKEELIKFMMNICVEGNVLDNNHFTIYKQYYLKNERFITDEYIKLLFEISEFEYKNNICN